MGDLEYSDPVCQSGRKPYPQKTTQTKKPIWPAIPMVAQVKSDVFLTLGTLEMHAPYGSADAVVSPFRALENLVPFTVTFSEPGIALWRACPLLFSRVPIPDSNSRVAMRAETANVAFAQRSC